MTNKETALETVTDRVTAEKVEAVKFPKVYTHFNLPPVKSVKAVKPSLTVEAPIYDNSPAEALKRYNGKDTSMFPNNPSLPVFGDFSNLPNIAEASLIVDKAKEQFNGLDATIRAKFNNDFKKFANYVNSSDFNIETLMTQEVKDGIYRRKQLDEAYAKQKKAQEDFLLAHPNYSEELAQKYQSELYKQFDEYLKSKNLLQG